MFYSDDIIEEVRMRSDIVDVISGYVRLQKKGSTYFGLCPFHNEKSPSFSVTPGKQMYYCFGCGAGGNVYTFLMEYESLTFPEAVKQLAERAGVTLPEREYSEEEKKKASLRQKLLEINKIAAKYYYYQLKSEKGQAAYEYFRGRELSDDTITKFGLGYSTKYRDDLYLYLKKEGFSDEVLRESGLVTIDERGAFDKFFNRAMFPIMDVNNKVIGFGGRVMGEGSPKYLNSPETKIFDKSRNLYGLNVARTSKKDYILVCEGYMDVIALHQAGFTNTVASLGTAFTTQHAALLKRYTNEVILTYDSDAAGVNAARRAIPILKEAGVSTKVLNMRPYKDPDEFIKSLGAEEFDKRIETAVNSFFFEIDVMSQNYSLEDPEEKTAFYNEIAKRLTEFTEELERDNYLEAIAKRYSINKDSLRKLVNSYGAKIGIIRELEKPKSSTGENKKNKEDGVKVAQKILLTWMIDDKSLYRKLRGIIGPSDFIDPLYNKVATLLFSQLEQDELNPAKIINNFTDSREQSDAASLFNEQLNEELGIVEREKALNETVFKVKKNSLDYRSKNAADINELQSIIREQAELRKLHISLE